MKKARNRFVVGLAALLSLCLIAFAACGDKGSSSGGGKVSDKEWAHYFSLVTESTKSITLEETEGSKYGKDQAEEYGEWDKSVMISKIDSVNEVIEQKATREYYDANAEGTDKFVTDHDTDYYFKYNGKYYHYDKRNQNEAEINEITKADFTQLVENMSNQTAMIQSYAQPAMKQMFKYNSDTKTYEMVQMGTMKIGFRFEKNDTFTYIMEENSLESYEITMSNADKTTVTVPNDVKAAVDAYIAAQAQA